MSGVKILGGSVQLRADPSKLVATQKGGLHLECTNSSNLPFFLTAKQHHSSQATAALSRFKSTGAPAKFVVNGRSGVLPGRNKLPPVLAGEWEAVAAGNSTLHLDVEAESSTGATQLIQPQEDVRVK